LKEAIMELRPLAVLCRRCRSVELHESGRKPASGATVTDSADQGFRNGNWSSDLRIDLNFDYGSLTSLVSRADQTIDTEQIAEQWDRMGQLYASLKTGHVTASVALKRLGPDTTMIGNESERQH
jgi:hypothetical protein